MLCNLGRKCIQFASTSHACLCVHRMRDHGIAAPVQLSMAPRHMVMMRDLMGKRVQQLQTRAH
jgi:hypothetical protein